MQLWKPHRCLLRSLPILLFFSWFLIGHPVSAERKITRRRVAPGCVFVILRDAEQELALYALNIDLHMPFLSVMPALSDGFPTERESVLSMARRMDRPGSRVVGGVNGDYFSAGSPTGLYATTGRVIKSGRGWSALAFDSGGRPRIERYRLQLELTQGGRSFFRFTGLNVRLGLQATVLYAGGFSNTLRARPGQRVLVVDPSVDSLPVFGRIGLSVEARHTLDQPVPIPEGRWALALGTDAMRSTPVVSSVSDCDLEVGLQPSVPGIQHVVSGGPRLLRSGRISVEREQEGQRAGFDTERHPRTAAGFSRDGRFLVLMVVDGRQPGYSRGVDLFELASLLKEFGCFEAMNLDGGGSTTLVVENAVANWPSDPIGPRPVANGLFVVYSGPWDWR